MEQINVLKLLSFFRIFWCVFCLGYLNTGIAQDLAALTSNKEVSLSDEDSVEEIKQEYSPKIAPQRTCRVPANCNDPACHHEYYYQPNSNQLNLNEDYLLRPTISYSVYCQIYNITINEGKIRCSKVDCMYVIPLFDSNKPVFNKKGDKIAKYCMIIEMDPPRALVSEHDPDPPLKSAKYYKVGGKLYKDGNMTVEDFSQNTTGFCSTVNDRIITSLDTRNATKEEIEDQIKKEPEPCIVKREVPKSEGCNGISYHYRRYQQYEENL